MSSNTALVSRCQCYQLVHGVSSVARGIDGIMPPGSAHGNVQEHRRKLRGVIRELFSVAPASVQKVSGRCHGCVQEMFWKRPECIQNVAGKPRTQLHHRYASCGRRLMCRGPSPERRRAVIKADDTGVISIGIWRPD